MVKRVYPDTYAIEKEISTCLENNRIVFQIPEILAYHEEFLAELRLRLEGWNRGKCIGDIFLETVSFYDFIVRICKALKNLVDTSYFHH